MNGIVLFLPQGFTNMPIREGKIHSLLLICMDMAKGPRHLLCHFIQTWFSFSQPIFRMKGFIERILRTILVKSNEVKK